MEKNFKKYATDRIDLLNEPFDYYSAMIYGPKQFSNNGKDTIVPLNKNIVLKDQNLLSQIDIREIKKLYQCKNFENFLFKNINSYFCR